LSFKYILLGGGNASGYAAKEFVNKGVKPGQLCVITSEPYVAYERPALSKAFLFPEKPARLPGFHTCVGLGMDRQEADWYAEKGIEYKLNTTVTAADVTAKTLKCSSGEALTYDSLVVATGARPVRLTEFGVPGADLDGLYYLRNVVDGNNLVDAMAACKAGDNQAVVVGGGYIGMECAAALNMNGLDVTMVFPEENLMQRLFTPEVAEFYESFYAEKGIKIIKGALASSFEGKNGKVTHVVLKNGVKVPGSLVVVGTGARANKELFDGQLDMEAGGIKTNGQLQSSSPNVYAIGDVAAFPLKKYGGYYQRQEHVQNCRLSAFHAVSAIMAPEETGDYDYLPYFYSRVFNLSWQLYGVNKGESVFFGDKPSGKFGMYWVDGGKIVGAFLESGSPEEFAAIKTVAAKQPQAPSSAELAAKGLEFALAVARQ